MCYVKPEEMLKYNYNLAGVWPRPDGYYVGTAIGVFNLL